jgi:hypothetical protein
MPLPVLGTKVNYYKNGTFSPKFNQYRNVLVDQTNQQSNWRKHVRKITNREKDRQRQVLLDPTAASIRVTPYPNPQNVR